MEHSRSLVLAMRQSDADSGLSLVDASPGQVARGNLVLMLSQLSLPFLGLMAADASAAKRRVVGLYGELMAARLFEAAGYAVTTLRSRSRRGDLLVIDTSTGESFRVEVKTARQGVDRKYRFVLMKRGHSDYRDAEFLLLMPLLPRSGKPVPFLIPVSAFPFRTTAVIYGDPRETSGMWSPWRVDGRLKIEVPHGDD